MHESVNDRNGAKQLDSKVAVLNVMVRRKPLGNVMVNVRFLSSLLILNNVARHENYDATICLRHFL